MYMAFMIFICLPIFMVAMVVLGFSFPVGQEVGYLEDEDRIDIVTISTSCGDWEILYINGEKKESAHILGTSHIFEHIVDMEGKVSVTQYFLIEVDNEEDVPEYNQVFHWTPDKLIDIIDILEGDYFDKDSY